MYILWIFFALLLPVKSFSQSQPIGLFEGLMANTGVASTHSTAASIYNPSLLRSRQGDAVSLSGSTVSSMTTRDKDSSFGSSLSLAPAYLSNVIVGDNLVHEFFIANSMQGKFSWEVNRENFVFEADANISTFTSGYSMAFKSLPLALQVLARYSGIDTFGVAENFDNVNNINVVSRSRTSYKNLNLALGVSTHITFDHYTLGVNFNTRGWSIYKDSQSQSRNYIHGSPNPGDFTVTNTSEGNSMVSNTDGFLSIGHGFKVGHHEFLTDSTFREFNSDLNTYEYMQSFGYRYGDKNGHQVLCGIGHAFGEDVDYLGQKFTASVGYSWFTRSLRSAFGLYFSRDYTAIRSHAVGLSFGSEYSY